MLSESIAPKLHQNDLGFLIRQTDIALSRRMNQSLERSKLTRSQGFMLKCILHHGGKASLKELEHDIGSAQSTTWGIAKRLEEKGFVDLIEDPTDSRARIVQLTDSGRRVCEGTRSSVLSLEDHLRANFSDEERKQYVEYLERTLEAVNSWEDDSKETE